VAPGWNDQTAFNRCYAQRVRRDSLGRWNARNLVCLVGDRSSATPAAAGAADHRDRFRDVQRLPSLWEAHMLGSEPEPSNTSTAESLLGIAMALVSFVIAADVCSAIVTLAVMP
jgi:hypothetical protein